MDKFIDALLPATFFVAVIVGIKYLDMLHGVEVIIGLIALSIILACGLLGLKDFWRDN